MIVYEHFFRSPGHLRGAMLTADETYCTALDRFPFAMRVERRNGLHVMAKVFPA